MMKGKMSNDERHAPAEAGSDEDYWPGPVSIWWLVLALLVLSVGLTNFGFALSWLLRPSENYLFHTPGVVIMVAVFGFAQPKTIKQVAITVAIAAATGALAILGHATAVVVSESTFMFILSAVVSSGVFVLVIRPLLGYFGIPQRSGRARSGPAG